MKHLFDDKLPELLSENELNFILDHNKKRTPEWFFLSEKMSIQHHFQLAERMKQRDRQRAEIEMKNMSEEEIKMMKLHTLKWGATRWNDGNYDLDFEYKESQKYRTSKRGQISKIRKSRLDSLAYPEKFTIFSSNKSPFSNFYISRFTLENIEFNSVVQYMMYKKAILFLDEKTATRIINETVPEKAYSLGSNVQNYDKTTWKNMYFGNHLKVANEQKFLQNTNLKDMLMSTYNSTIILACRSDKYFGIGLSRNDKNIEKRDKWRGYNVLGEMLSDICYQFADH